MIPKKNVKMIGMNTRKRADFQSRKICRRSFIAKWMMLIAALQSGKWLPALVLMAGSFLAIAYVFKVVSQLFVIPPDAPKYERHRQAGFLEWPALVLALISLLMGLFASYPLQYLDNSFLPLAAIFTGGGP